MKTVSISGSTRANVGKRDARELRGKESIPGVIYGGKEQIHFYAPEAQFRSLVYTPDVHTIDLSLDGKNYKAILQDIQFHKVTDKILHVDFLEIVPGKPVTLSLPITTVGSAAGVKAGGKLVKKLRKLKVRGLVEKMPDKIQLDIEKLEVGQSIRVKDIQIDGLQLLDTPNSTVVGVDVTRAVAADSPAAKPAAGAAAKPAAGAAGAAAKPAAGAAKPAAKK
jgi:large subunit ribosomal protein L25